MSYLIRCGVRGSKTPLYSVPFPTLEEAEGALMNWKRRDDWVTLEIWEVLPPELQGKRKPQRVHREVTEKIDA